MNVIDNIENLLSNNLITKQEYDMLLKEQVSTSQPMNTHGKTY